MKQEKRYILTLAGTTHQLGEADSDTEIAKLIGVTKQDIHYHRKNNPYFFRIKGVEYHLIDKVAWYYHQQNC